MYPDDYQLTVVLVLLSGDAPKTKLFEAVDSLIYRQKLIPAAWTHPE